MNGDMLSSETAGTPSGKRAVLSASFVPGELSVTMPFMRTVLPSLSTSFCIDAVMAVCPLPNV